jgi:iron complex transport system substrate-binding protein
LTETNTSVALGRVACLQPSATSTLEALGLLERVVACTRHCAALCPELDRSRVAVIEDSWTAQAQQVVAVHPDLVIAAVPYQVEAVAEILKAGVRVLLFSPKTLADVYGDIAAVAGILRVPERGDQVIRKMQEQIEAVRARTAGRRKPRVYCEEWGKPIIVAQRWVAEMVEAAGGTFTGEAGKQIGGDDVRGANPEVIIFGWCGTGDRVPAEQVIAEREWQNVDAVRNGRVYVVRDDFLTTPGPTLTVGLEALAHAIHPRLFPVEPIFGGQRVMRGVRRMSQEQGPGGGGGGGEE